MMKNSVVAAIFFLVICAVASDAEAVSDFPKVDTGSKFPSAQGFSLKCFSALRDEGKTCSRDIFFSFWTHRVLVGSDCCQAMQEAKEDCSAALFSHFKHIFLPETGKILRSQDFHTS
ncbi:hypothetical protein CIPAW_13G108500 [Carya illinoinensis]|uniref:Prolamin-like domain-containing protein n=1 Tax=Carya illinoinensis TaxID=32201 RepID=A0A8T1NSJ4_CARIL|nr:hypothetical protein CIPAW_13G108500 [Carya illinoinensis]